MIFIGLGGNLPGAHGDAAATLRAALDDMRRQGVTVKSVSPFYRSAPVPASDQPWFVNAVADIATPLPPEDVLRLLLDIEKKFGRTRAEKNAARVLDLDLLDYAGMALRMENLVLPHPLMHRRAFVLLPLRDIAPAWAHPVTREKLDALIAALPVQAIEKIAG
jgi:2-amino-4-hydroxy-6-hydroxymethyldihydropteridine diphosphokinase